MQSPIEDQPRMMAVISCRRGSSKSFSSGTTLPSPSASGIRHSGYSLLVPGWFCVRFSPTASTMEEP